MEAQGEASGSNVQEHQDQQAKGGKKKQKLKVDKEGKRIREEWLDMVLSTNHIPDAQEKREIHRQIQATNPEYTYEGFSSWFSSTRNSRLQKAQSTLERGHPLPEEPIDTSFLSLPLSEIEAMIMIIRNFSPDPKEAPLDSFAELSKCSFSVVRSLHAYICYYGPETAKKNIRTRFSNFSSSISAPEERRPLNHLPTPAPSEPPPDTGDHKESINLFATPQMFPNPPMTPVSPTFTFQHLHQFDISGDSDGIPFHPQGEEFHQENDSKPFCNRKAPPTDLQSFLQQLSEHDDWMDYVLDHL
ncbi:hypothetical protein SCHPADRAFT_930161 [Schizopora paradoxa]|uniref:Uncharacterized protein n=1 Tax=Schizopora paradoxa TaxID=27342 RepID=A0A0H2RGX8_9AGAM|nr:hypothetical protein SCHPADRAFT_930161 [Schizopora paradoxa]